MLKTPVSLALNFMISSSEKKFSPINNLQISFLFIGPCNEFNIGIPQFLCIISCFRQHGFAEFQSDYIACFDWLAISLYFSFTISLISFFRLFMILKFGKCLFNFVPNSSVDG